MPSDALAGSASTRAAGVDYCYQAYSVKTITGGRFCRPYGLEELDAALVGRIAQENV